MRPFNRALRTFALGAVLAVLGGCSEYIDRRDTIALSGGNAVATNTVIHMVDPWPRMQGAFERYRTNRVITPRGIGTSSTYNDGGGNSQNNGAPVGPSVATPSAAPVK